MAYVTSPTDDRLLEARFSWDGCGTDVGSVNVVIDKPPQIRYHVTHRLYD